MSQINYTTINPATTYDGVEGSLPLSVVNPSDSPESGLTASFLINTTTAIAIARNSDEDVFKLIRFIMQLFQLLVGFVGNMFSLIVLLLYRHYLSHPFWFYLAALCTVDLFGCVAFLIEMEDPLDIYHDGVFATGFVNTQLEQWILNMIRDLSAWLIVFIAIERWKSVCWKHHSQHQNAPVQSPVRQPESSARIPASPQFGVFGLASFKRRTAQLEIFFIVTGGLMIVNASNYFANENNEGEALRLAAMKCLKNVTMNGTSMSFISAETNMTGTIVISPRANTTLAILAEQWTKAWPVVNELKRCWLPALVLLVLNCWIVVYTVRFLWNAPPLMGVRRRFAFRRLTSSSISNTPAGQTATQTTVLLGGSMSPIAASAPQNSNANQQQQQQENSPQNLLSNPTTQPASPTAIAPIQPQASIVYHRTQARRRRRLVFAWLTLLALPTIFIALTLPLSIQLMVNEYSEKPCVLSTEAFEFQNKIDALFRWLSDCNHTINCFIYCLTIAKFRTAVCRIFHWFSSKITILRKKHAINDDVEQQCQLVNFLERARQLHRCRNAKKRRFVVGVVENVEAISDFQHHNRYMAAVQLGIRRASGMESGIAFDENAQFYE